MSEAAINVAIRMMQAEEAIASCEIENGPMTRAERFRLKMQLIWPDLSGEDLDLVTMHMIEASE